MLTFSRSVLCTGVTQLACRGRKSCARSCGSTRSRRLSAAKHAASCRTRSDWQAVVCRASPPSCASCGRGFRSTVPCTARPPRPDRASTSRPSTTTTATRPGPPETRVCLERGFNKRIRYFHLFIRTCHWVFEVLHAQSVLLRSAIRHRQAGDGSLKTH